MYKFVAAGKEIFIHLRRHPSSATSLAYRLQPPKPWLWCIQQVWSLCVTLKKAKRKKNSEELFRKTSLFWSEANFSLIIIFEEKKMVPSTKEVVFQKKK